MKLPLLILLPCLLSAQFFPFPGPGKRTSAGGGGGSITQVQKVGYFSTATALNHNVTFPGAPTAGNVLIMGIISDDNPVTPSGWTRVGSIVCGFTCQAFYWKVSAGTETTTSVGCSAGVSVSCVAAAFEYSGMSTPSPIDQSANSAATGGAGTVNTGTTGTTTQANELLIALIGVPSVTETITSWSDSFVQEYQLVRTGAGSPLMGGFATRIVSSTGAFTTTATKSSTTGNSIGMIATFKGL